MTHMSNDVNVVFCRGLLREAHKLVKKHFPRTNLLKDAWTYGYGRNNWEFHGPNKFFWDGKADNAFDARYKGWMAYLRANGKEE